MTFPCISFALIQSQPQGREEKRGNLALLGYRVERVGVAEAASDGGENAWHSDFTTPGVIRVKLTITNCRTLPPILKISLPVNSS